MSTDYELHWKTLSKDLRALAEFPMESFCDRLYNKARASQRAEPLAKYLQRRNPYPKDDVHATDNWLDETMNLPIVDRLADASLARALGQIDDSKDTLGLKQCVNQDNAERTDLELMSNLLAFCLGEHINFTLRGAVHRTLHQLGDSSGFASYVEKKVKEPTFIKKEIFTDEVNKNHFYSLCILFVTDYLERRGVDEIWGAERLPAYNDDYRQRPSFGIMRKWSKYMWENGGRQDADQMDRNVEFCGRVSPLVFCAATETGKVEPQPTWNLIDGLHQHLLTAAEKTADDEDYAQAVRLSLDRQKPHRDAINALQNMCQEVQGTWQLNSGLDWQNAMSSGLAQEDSQLKAWVNDGRVWEMNNVEESERIFTRRIDASLVAGTSITLSDASVLPVEKVTEATLMSHRPDVDRAAGAHVELQLGDSQITLVGFNGEAPFATDDQVFYTSSGLRAVNPQAAGRRNPFANIGRLRVGHVLYRLKSGVVGGQPEYEHHTIESMQLVPVRLQGVCGLSPGVSSYHANGYLLHAATPGDDKTTARDLLKRLPASQRMLFLASLPEMGSTMRQHDIQAIYDRLTQELGGVDGEEKFTSASFADPGQRRKAITLSTQTFCSGVPVENLGMEFDLRSSSDKILPAGYNMPTVRLLDGLLLLNGEVNPRVAIHAGQRTVRWSRPIEGALVEHGALRIYPDGLGGYGAIQLSSSPEPTAVLAPEVFGFKAVPRTAAARRAGSYIDPFFQVKMTYDKEPWDKDTTRTKPVNPTMGDTIALGIYHADDGSTLPVVTIPVLDQLQQEINQKTGSELSQLYDGTVNMLDSGQFQVNIVVDQASLLPFLSDAGADIEHLDLDFKDVMGVDIQMPMLFQELQFLCDLDEFTAEGALFEYNPDMRGQNGERHFVQGEMDMFSSHCDQVSPKALRREVSEHLAQRNPCPAAMTAMVTKPAEVTAELEAQSDPDIDNLLKMEYHDQAIHNSGQTLILQTLYYHMSDDQRTLLNITQPQHLAPGLAEDLPGNLKSFLRDVYAPAYIGQMVSTVKEYEDVLNNQEQEKIWYWFQGQGDKCLAKCQEYSDLNNLTSIEAMRETYGNILDPFMPTPTDAHRWAEKIRDSVMSEKSVKKCVWDCEFNGGYLQINKICMILNTLDTNNTFAEDWFVKVISALRDNNLHYPFIDDDEAPHKQWLDDAMQDLLVAIFSGDPSVTDEVRAGLLKDIEEFEKANNIQVVSDAKERAANIMTYMTYFSGEAAKWLSSVGKVIQKAFSGTRMYTWMGKAFDEIADKVVDVVNVKVMEGVATLTMGAFYLFQIGFSVYQLYQNWDQLDEGQRATIILETFKTLCNAIEHAAPSVLAAWKRYKQGKAPETPQDFLDAAMLDQQTEKELLAEGKEFQIAHDEVYGENALRNTIAEGIADKGAAGELKKLAKWNESRDEMPADIPGGDAEAASKFSIQGSFMRIVNAAIGIGVCVAMTFSLVHDWPDMSTLGKILNTTSLVIQYLTVVIDIIEVGSMVGLYVVSGTLAVALPIFGAILAVLGIVVMILLVIFGGEEQHPPRDPIKDYINDVVKPLVDGWDDPPSVSLIYSPQRAEMDSGQAEELKVDITNNTEQDITLKSTTLTLIVGDDDVCLFSDDGMQLAQSSDSDKDQPGHVYLDTSVAAEGSVTTDTLGTTSEYHQVSLDIFGAKNEKDEGFSDLVVKASETVTVVWSGTVARAGKSILSIVERLSLDRTHARLPITRV